MERAHFREVQKFNHILLWILLGVIAAFVWYSFIVQIFLGVPVGNNPAPDIVMWIILIVVGIGFPALFGSMKLVVEVSDSGVMINFFPIKKRFLRFEEIEKAKAMKYKPIRQYGGWGIKFGKGGNVYSVSGNEGVRVDLTNSKHVMIGSKRSKDLEKAINKETG